MQRSEMSLVDRLRQRAAERPDALAVDDGQVQLTYGALLDRAEGLAAEMLATPAAADAPVGIHLPVCTDYIVAIVAALVAGRTYVPLDASLPERRNRRIISHSGLRMAIVDARTSDALAAIDPDIARIPVTAAAPRVAPQPAANDPDRIIALFYTSGSTGEPKGVCQDQKGLLHDLDDYVERARLSPDDRASMMYSPSVSASNRDIFATLITGATMIVMNFKVLGLAGAMAELRRTRVNVYHSVPSVFRTLFATDDDATRAVAETVRWVRINGDRVLPTDVALFRARFPVSAVLCVDIASTETKTYAGWLVDRDTPMDRSLVPVGRPPRGVDLALVGDDGRPVAAGEVGEIVVASASMAIGYWRDEAMTQARFTPSTLFPGRRQYRTGDMGRYRPDGLLEFIGRRDGQLKVRGNTVHLGEIEAVISNCPAVKEVGIVGRESAGDVKLVAYCVMHTHDAREETVRGWCRERLSAAMCPSSVVIVNELPKLPIGKVDLDALKQIDAARALEESVAEAAPIRDADGLMQSVQVQWTALLGAAAFRADLTFEAAGGDSLKAMQMLLGLERELGRRLPNDLIHLGVRPSGLAADLAAHIDNKQTPVRDDSRPRILIFSGVYGTDFDIIDFARRLGAEFPVDLIDYRQAHDHFIGPADRERLFQAVEQALAADAPRRLWVFGYSFGARVAAEAAARLAARGQSIELIGILDGPTEAAIRDRRSLRHAEGPSTSKPLTLSVRTSRRVAHRLLDRNAFGPLRWWINTLRRLKLNDAAERATMIVLARTRIKAFAGLPITRTEANTVVFVSTQDNDGARTTPDLGWSEYFPGRAVFTIDGDHAGLIAEQGYDQMLPILLDTETRLRPVAA